nr:MAG TPA: hypothetical protein [Caudoviricetes sp.]
MTVAELKQALSKYPDDMKIKVNIGHELRKLDDVSWGVDMDTNITCVWLVGKEKK